MNSISIYRVLVFTVLANLVYSYVFPRSFSIVSRQSVGSSPALKESNIGKYEVEAAQQASEASEQYKSVALSGFASKDKRFVNPTIFLNIFGKGFAETIICITDDIPFAKKRLVNPKTVYTGLIDVLNYRGMNSKVDADVLKEVDAWIAYDILSSELPELADTAVKAGLKRVVFAVHVQTEEEKGPEFTFAEVCDKLKGAGIDYTILKYSDPRKMEEAKFPYRIVRDVLPMPTGGRFNCLSQDDLIRVITETLDIEKTFNNVYGIGPGTQLDTEILTFMKSRGWPERVQVGLLMGDMMETIEQKFEEEQATQKAKQEAEAGAPKKTQPVRELGLPTEGKPVNKFAGFL